MNEIQMSVVLVTDVFGTIRETIRCLREQAEEVALEVVIVSPSRKALQAGPSELEGFAAVQVLETESIADLAAARAAGVRAATGPIVFLGETHIYPQSGWAKALIESHSMGWDAVTPGFDNANPENAISWANLLIDYGCWLRVLPAGEVGRAPTWNTSYRREILLEHGDRLGALLSFGDTLQSGLRRSGRRFYFEPAARMKHANVARFRPWLHQRYLGGLMIASERRGAWSMLRRLIYACGAPLLPPLALWRISGAVRRARREISLPRGTLPAIAIGLSAAAIGEFMGYVAGASARRKREMTEFELHKVNHGSLSASPGRIEPSGPPDRTAQGVETVSAAPAIGLPKSSTTNAVASLAIVLVTDAFETIRLVVKRLREQSAAPNLEIVIVTSSRSGLAAGEEELEGFASATVVELGRMGSLAAARAAGVRAASAPIVFLGETHSYPQAGWAEALIEAHRGEWAAVAPGFVNGNPENALSWAGLLTDYGPWLQGLPAREIDRVPTWNTAYKRDALLPFGDRLDSLLSFGDALQTELQARGCRFYFEPKARLEHVNISQAGSWLRERFLGGLLIASHRMAKWSRGRRLVYFLCSPLIPAVVLWRTVRGVRTVECDVRAPVATYGTMLAGALIMAFGEMLGYAGWPVVEASRTMDKYELHKIDYTGIAPAPDR